MVCSREWGSTGRTVFPTSDRPPARPAGVGPARAGTASMGGERQRGGSRSSEGAAEGASAVPVERVSRGVGPGGDGGR
jgi:hypothetical protein